MSAVPKKKLCWNCEGNVIKGADNCPYCGVYLHSDEIEESSTWNPNYRPQPNDDEIPTPLYQLNPEQEIDEIDESYEKRESKSITWGHLFSQLKRDLFPTLFLMMGSIFFLFGIVLILFSQNGTFTLQWQERDGLIFLFFAFPLMILGWVYLQRLEVDN